MQYISPLNSMLQAPFTRAQFKIYTDTQICIRVQNYTNTKHLQENNFYVFFGDVASWPWRAGHK